MTGSRLVAERPTSAADVGGSGVTAVVCTYRGAAHLEEQLASILTQTRPVDEVLVTDDGSDDGTVELAVRVLEAGGAPYRVYTRDEALRIAANAHFGIEHARTPFVAMADQDDAWRADKIERLLPLLADDDAALVAHSDAELVDEVGAPLGARLLDSLDLAPHELAEYEGGEQLRALLRRNLVTGATLLVRRDLALRAGVAPAPWIHDEWLAFVASLTNGIRLSHEPLIAYRQHDANQIGQRKLSFGEKVGRILEPGAERQRRKGARARVAVGRARELGADAAQETLLRRKAAHETAREGLPANRLARVPRVVRWALAGRYRVYSRGLGDVARDLLQSRADA